MNKLGGFTIIELVVVIAIIAILVAIVLVSASQYIAKGGDAAAKANLDTLSKNYALYYVNTGGFMMNMSGYFPPSNCTSGDSTYFTPICNALTKNTTFVSSALPTRWCASINLKQYTPTQYYCVDYTGARKQGTDKICDAGACP